MMVNASKNFESLVKNLLKLVPDIYAVAIIEKYNTIAYSTDNWDISDDIDDVCSSWDTMRAQYIVISGIKYIIIECEIDTLVATSIQNLGNIVACKDEVRKIIAYVKPEGNVKSAIVEVSRLLQKMNFKKIISQKEVQIGKLYTKMDNKKPNSVDPQLKAEIESLVAWCKNPNGLQAYIKYFLQKENTQIISELARIYYELRQIFGV